MSHNLGVDSCDLPLIVKSALIKLKEYVQLSILFRTGKYACALSRKYFFVNTKTGEKSGEMLASVKLG